MNTDRMIGAFFFADRLYSLSPTALSEGFRRLVDVGVDTVIIESEDYRDEVIEAAHQSGLRFWGGISCFLAPTDEVLESDPELWPLLSTGERRPRMEWYNGVVPTVERHREQRLDAISKVVETHDLDGFLLDFVRWPSHWEIELRAGHPPPLESSFDHHTLELFRDWADLDLPTDDPAQASTWIMANAGEAWVSFKCAVITSFVESARERVSDRASRSMALGLCLVPVFPDWVGQRVEDLSRVADVLCPMSYHSVLHRGADWVGGNVGDFVRRSERPVVPIVQIDTDGLAIGADLGPKVPDRDLTRMVADSLDNGASGVIAFTGSELLKGGRGDALSRGLG